MDISSSHLHNQPSDYDSGKACHVSALILSDDHRCQPQYARDLLHESVLHSHEVPMSKLSKGAFQKLPMHLDDSTSFRLDELWPTPSEEIMEKNVSLHFSSEKFQKLPMHLDDASSVTVIDELQPPKSEEISERYALSKIRQVHSFKLGWYTWKTTLQVALMISRLKIHEIVMKELKSIYLDDAIEKAMTMKQSLRRYQSGKKVVLNVSDN